MYINRNVMAMNAYRNLTGTQNTAMKATERLSSGLRINRAADDAAGLAISESLRAQVNGLNQAETNSRDGINLLQAAEGGLNETHAILQRMRTLAVQANNDTNSAENLEQIQAEMVQLQAEIDSIADRGEFNGMKLLDGTFVKKHLQVGANAGNTTEITIGSKRSDEVPAAPAGVSLWNMDQADQLALIPNPLEITHTMTSTGNVTTASVPLDLNTDVADIVAQLNAHPDFSANFTATLGHIDRLGQPTRWNANIVITANEAGAATVEVPNRDLLAYSKILGGADEKPAEYGGYHAAEILGGFVDVRPKGHTEEYTFFQPYVPGHVETYEDFGNLKQRWVDEQPEIGPETRYREVGDGATDAIRQIDAAIRRVSDGRGELGAWQNALEHTARNVALAAENLAASESRIRDTDMAKEMVNLTRSQILQQAGVSMLAQANLAPQSVLRLLG